MGFASEAGTRPDSTKTYFRLDIQGLRAIAVLLVLVYHVWPQLIPGGFIGVDVFFVISGYLITSLLKRELERDGRVSLASFYTRRVRRLLPAALLVLAATLMGSLIFLPVTLWRATGHEIIASALYVENWWLSYQAVDYLALDSAPSPVQHFWSLSVEEQFYFFWPLLLAFAYWLGRRKGGVLASIAALGVVLLASLGYSIWSGLAGESAAYFSTFSRVWQLAAGGLLAFMGPARRTALPALGLGLGAIVAAAVFLSGSVSYPGYIALVPTLGAMLALHGGEAHLGSVATRWLSSAPARFIGDISYSLYLWHWPLIVFYKAKAGAVPGVMAGFCLVAVSLVLAALTKRFVEDRFRHGSAAVPSWRPVGIGLAASFALVAATVLVNGMGGREGEGGGISVDSSSYPGAAVMSQPGQLAEPVAGQFLPQLPHVEGDVADAYAQDCIQNIQGTDVKKCVYGSPSARLRIAVVGDSHAVHWLPAFQELANQYDVYVEGITKTSCITSGLPVYHQKLKKPYSQCGIWTRNVVSYLNGENFDLIVVSQSPKHRVFGKQARSPISQAGEIAGGMAAVWSGLHSGKLTVIRPTPWQSTLVRDCVASNDVPYDPCIGKQDVVLFDNALSRFARLAKAPLLDFSDMFCRNGLCPPIIGNVFVYRDAHHVTGSYMRTLAPVLADRLGMPLVRLRADARPAKISISTRPALITAGTDRDEAFAAGCVQPLKSNAARSCRLGGKGPIRIAVVGDATGANILPALRVAAGRRGWRVETFLKESCLWSERPVWNRKLKRAFDECSNWTGRVSAQLIKSPPDMVVLAQSPMYTDARARSIDLASPRLAAGIAPLVQRLQDAGVKVLALKTLPWLPQNVPQCLLTRSDLSACGAEREASLPTGALDRLMSGNDSIGKLDLTQAFCPGSRCEGVIDGVLVYRDASQPTRTFMYSLAPVVEAQIGAALGPARPRDVESMIK